jgi:hypothetical protein
VIPLCIFQIAIPGSKPLVAGWFLIAEEWRKAGRDYFLGND